MEQTVLPQNKLIATSYYSGFPLAHDTYNALSPASDGKIYYILSSEDLEIGGHFYVYDPQSDKVDFIGDLTEICGEKGNKTIGQGKSHVQFYESRGKLYFSTHVGYYELIDGMDRLPENPPNNFGLYPGGHILSYDMKTGKCEDLVTIPGGEGMVSMTMDTQRGEIFGITWPTGHFVHYNVQNDQLNDLGPVAFKGEGGTPGDDFRVLCRSLVVDPRDGTVYFSNAEGDILYYHPQLTKVQKMEDADLRLDYFGQYDPTRPGSMGYNWRKVFWYPDENVIYGVHGNSGYLFRFSPDNKRVEIVERITSEPSRKSGMYDQFSYGYLGFDLGPDNETIYYLTGGPIYKDGKRIKGVDQIAKGAARGLENLHLITFHIPSGKYIDHGPITYSNGEIPTYVNAIAIGKTGEVYTLARMEHKGSEIQDLVKIPNPFK
ncbi:hypothetical protein [Membranihabitans maritimus]|uniref:hypothetical protein n=1 Tax=Membranihabitans maritimus TaxID=2904244 RepID=UPI001F16C2A0|nr:hypothetical protein [Membranihabitans maritimus]